ncbi:hypothetical protein PR003_g24446 [Phytophthora rubi]|uniref:Uncharacterized protein n=1 Tax=Phytophthora rubi TaxID=129364 RepID=A0A6A3IRQ6_9STRA|nr:hypothetical protein PR001_g23163 [Phytophthora rubi]KAE9293677.1 hypothetical protein PR003_g24446 [Phytophthora rubi]
MGDVSVNRDSTTKLKHELWTKKTDLSPSHRNTMFSFCGRLRQVALISIAAMGLWPLALQVMLAPQSVFGDGHGDRYEELSYFAFENDHYQVLAPRKLDCRGLQTFLFGGATPTATTDLLRAIPQSTFETVRSYVVNQTTADTAQMLSVSSDILGLPADSSLCFGGVDAEGAIQIETLLSAVDSAAFGVDASCLQGTASHVRVRLQSTEFYVPDTMGELNPSRVSGAMLIVSLLDKSLSPVESSCYDATREARYAMTEGNSEYLRLVTVYSKHLLVEKTCAGFTLFGGKRDTFGCAYSALGTSGAVANLNSDGAQRTYSYPAPWRMIQCSKSGECSSLLFTQLWLSEWTVQQTTSGEVLRHNFVNQKVNEVTVDNTFSIRLVINLQILALVVTAYVTSARGWYKLKCAFISPWAKVMNATTSCTIAKVVRSSYNFILVAQMVLSMMQWRKQLTIDLLVGADTNQAVLRAFGCGTLVVVLAINVIFARAGDLKMQEMEPSFAHVVGFLVSIILFLVSRTESVSASARALLATGMRSVSASDLTQYSGCRGSNVCAMEASLSVYTLVLTIIILGACFIGLTAHAMLQASTRTASKIGASARVYFHARGKREFLSPGMNSFTRFLDDRSRNAGLYDCSTEIYIKMPGEPVLSTRAQLEACGFVLASSILFRYRDLPLFLFARILPIQILNFFNLTVTTYELIHTSRMMNGVPIGLVADQVIHTHWSKLKDARLDWMDEYFGGDGETSYRSASTDSMRRQQVRKEEEEDD